MHQTSAMTHRSAPHRTERLLYSYGTFTTQHLPFLLVVILINRNFVRVRRVDGLGDGRALLRGHERGLLARRGVERSHRIDVDPAVDGLVGGGTARVYGGRFGSEVRGFRVERGLDRALDSEELGEGREA